MRYPLVSVKNVYIFPGIPTLLQRAFNRLKDDLFKSDYQSHVQQVFVTQTEIHIADSLNHLVEKYKDSVTFGSYPTWFHNYYQTKITVEAESAQLVDSVVSELKSQMPSIESFDKFPFEDKMNKINTLLAESKVWFQSNLNLSDVNLLVSFNFRWFNLRKAFTLGTIHK